MGEWEGGVAGFFVVKEGELGDGFDVGEGLEDAGGGARDCAVDSFGG